MAVLVVIFGIFAPNRLIGQEETTKTSPLPQTLSDSEIAEGWISLFDGQSLYGWKPTSKVNWSVVDGEIRASEGEIGLLRTTSQFDDYELRLEYQSEKGTNSGVFLRTSPHPRNPIDDCYEFNIAPVNNPFPTGSLVGRAKSDVDIADDKNWHQLSISVRGGSISAWIDEQKTIEFNEQNRKGSLGRGYIGLQFNQGKIRFRNIVLRPLNLNPMLNQQISQWTDEKAEASRFTMHDEGILNVRGGSGQLETREQFGDFIFSMRCKTNKVGLNSGIFYRCIPGDLMNGYESQIQNEFVDGDPRQPKDCGTGGIFHRTTARKIVAEDRAWFSKTIIAVGPHVSVWVNGYQVTDWTDKRPENENPRKGKRLKRGTICIQGHDPTTDIDFKDLKIRELTVRRPRQP